MATTRPRPVEAPSMFTGGARPFYSEPEPVQPKKDTKMLTNGQFVQKFQKGVKFIDRVSPDVLETLWNTLDDLMKNNPDLFQVNEKFKKG